MVGYEDILASMFGAGFLAAISAFLVVFVIIALALYIYSALVLMAIAKKTKTPNGWLAFIPIANVYLMVKIAKLSGWFTLIVLVPIIPVVGSLALTAGTIWFWWRIAENIKKPGWWSLLMLVPVLNLIIMGIMAWGK